MEKKKIKIYFFFLKNSNFYKKSKKNKKKNPFCVFILGLCDLTRALQSSPFLRKRSKKISKITSENKIGKLICQTKNAVL